MNDNNQDTPSAITGGCLCSAIRYTVNFNEEYPWPPTSSACQFKSIPSIDTKTANKHKTRYNVSQVDILSDRPIPRHIPQADQSSTGHFRILQRVHVLAWSIPWVLW
ncbi:hypothetical protein FOYG_11001 [Fusarium oxysporum NRRL 32931]|uniref:Uncharacterized protein n=1 Tax=Fusarium oxysporum NRRL 32931 TaxID=660029 RepID=W9HZP7_FUSOX|nr:hypothetical protein FOYG_11001 [Fusarium oxysporum NRRL 32931]